MLSTIQVPLLVTVTVSTPAPAPDVPPTAGEIKLGQSAAGKQSLSAAAQKARDAMGKMIQTSAEKLSDAITGAAPGEIIVPVGKVAPKRGRKLRASPVAKPAKAKLAKRKARAPKSDNAAKVVDAITRGAEKFADLLVSTGIKRATLRAVLGRLKKDGKIFGAGKKFEMVYGRTQAEADKRFEAKKAK